MADTYTIKKIDTVTGNTTVSFSVDGKDQVIANLPVGDAAALDQALSDYLDAYKAGLAIEAATVVDPVVTAQVNKPQTITEATPTPA